MLIAFTKQCLLIPIFVGTAIPIEEVSKIGIFYISRWGFATIERVGVVDTLYHEFESLLIRRISNFYLLYIICSNTHELWYWHLFVGALLRPYWRIKIAVFFKFCFRIDNNQWIVAHFTIFSIGLFFISINIPWRGYKFFPIWFYECNYGIF